MNTDKVPKRCAKGLHGKGSEQTKRSEEEKVTKGRRMIGVMTIEEISEKLQAFVDDPEMHTNESYSPAANDYPGNKMPFVDFHLQHLKNHKNVNPEHYISNLRLMITKR